MKRCPKCNRTYEDEANFCLTDATPLVVIAPVLKQCPSCQRTYPPEASFCMTDGTALVAGTTQSPAPTTQPEAAVNTQTKAKPKTRTRAKKAANKKLASAPDPKATFTIGMTKWLQQSGYSIGLTPQKVDTEGDLKFAEKIADVASTIITLSTSTWLTSGNGSEELFQALVPYIPYADLLGSRLDLQMVKLIPVIYADELDPHALEQRFDHFIEIAGPLTEFGPRLNFQSQGSANIFPLLVYFDQQKFAAQLPELLPFAWQKRIMRRIYLMAGLVNVPEQTVTWPERTGFFSLGDKLAHLFGTKAKIFDNSDVAAVLNLAGQTTATQ